MEKLTIQFVLDFAVITVPVEYPDIDDIEYLTRATAAMLEEQYGIDEEMLLESTIGVYDEDGEPVS